MIEIIVANPALFEQRLEEYCQLYELCFNQKMTTQEARWRYLEHPKKDLFACFALDDGKLVASYSASPVELRINGEVKKAILSLNTMTHPDYTGRGLFVDLAKRVYKHAEELGYVLVFGFPNYISNRTFVSKLNWKDIYEIPTMELTINERLIKRLESTYDAVEEDSAFALNYDSCNYGAQQKVAVEKNQNFLQWRYADNPVNNYKNFVVKHGKQVRSYVVVKEYKERLNIIDYYFADNQDMELLISWCVIYGSQLGKTMVTTWAKMGEKLHLLLEKMGFRNNYPITYIGASILGNAELDIFNYQTWVVRMGDDNVY